MEKIEEKVVDYYQSDETFAWYSTIFSTDYSGTGLYPEEATVDGIKMGAGVKSVREAMICRDQRILDQLIAHAPAGRLKVLELGSGRGGLTRFIATELKKRERLLQMRADNLTQRENDYNMGQAKIAGLSEDEFLITQHNFHELEEEEPNSFDVVLSNDAFNHSNNRYGIIVNIARILKPGGIIIFTDLMCTEEAKPE